MDINGYQRVMAFPKLTDQGKVGGCWRHRSMISVSVTHRHKLCLNDNLHFLCLDAAFNAFIS